MKIAVLLTSFNRKEKTKECLQSLYKILSELDVYLVDDNSTDGTVLMIEENFPQINIIRGNGNLFWNRGMHLAWEHASKRDYEYYIWLNDDTLLYENSFIELFECSKTAKDNAIITGIIESEDKAQIIYGGTDSKKNLLLPNGTMQAVTNMNGNIVLIPKAVFNVLGNLDPVYHHDLGDVDYGLRAKENNIPVYSTRIAIGSGDKNNLCRIRLAKTTLRKRFEKLYSPLGNHPIINFYFRKKHFGVFNAIAYYVFLHIINLLPDIMVNKIFGSKYL